MNRNRPTNHERRRLGKVHRIITRGMHHRSPMWLFADQFIRDLINGNNQEFWDNVIMRNHHQRPGRKDR